MVFFDETDLLVYVITTATGEAELQSLTTDYTISGGDGTTGTVTMLTAPSALQTLLIKRVVPYVQATDFVNNDSSDAEVLEDAQDKIVMGLQQLAADKAYPIRLSDAETPTDAKTVLPFDRASKVLGFNASKELEMYEPESAVTSAANVTFTASGSGAPSSPSTRTVAVKLGETVLSVKDCKNADGSTVAGDGSQDDTTGIQVALDTGRPVYFPPGTYKTTATLNLNATANIGQIVYGAGCLREDNLTGTQKTLIQPSSAVTVAIGVVGGVLSIRGFELRDFTVDMTNMTDAATRIGIRQSSAWSAKIKNITFAGVGTAKRIMKFEAAAYLTVIENVRARGGIVELDGNSLADAATTLTFLNCDVDSYIMDNAASINIIGGAVQGSSDKFVLSNVDGLTIIAADIEGTGVFLNCGSTVSGISQHSNWFGGFSGTFSSGTWANDGGLFYRETNSWVPAITFGGAAVGVSYHNQGASATREGNRVHVTLDLIVNSNGSSTGDAAITGLPYAGSASFSQDFAINVNNGTLTGQLFGRVATSATSITLFVTDNGATAAATEANITDNCTMRATFTYMVD